MPYEAHPAFETPALDTTLWRYMDLARLLHLLTQHRLWFSAADRLGDRWEGALGQIERERFDRDYEEWVRAMAAVNAGEQVHRFVIPNDEKNVRELHSTVHVSCWHAGEHESAAMWAAYGSRGPAVAVRTTVERLRGALAEDGAPVFIGWVRYVDYETEPIERGNFLDRFLTKRLSFEHEREVRAVVWRPHDHKEGPQLPGVPVRVTVNELIDSVHVNPLAPSWQLEAIESTLRRLGLEAPVHRSALDRDPIY